MRSRLVTTTLLVLGFVTLTGSLASPIVRAAAGGGATTTRRAAAAAPAASVAHGKYMVDMMGCNDCHTPWKLGPMGPEPDMTRSLTGHPADLAMPAPPVLAGPWAWVAGATNTAFAGPWGVSYAANLTPDPETGLGRWTPEMFIATMRTGRHQGKGRPVLPPMPWRMIGQATDQDLRDIFAYLQSLKPVKNAVPQPVDPSEHR